MRLVVIVSFLLCSTGCFRHTTKRPPPKKVEGDLELRQRTVTVPGRSETRPKQVSKMVPTYRSEYKCRSVQKPVTRYETVYESQYDHYTKSYRTVPRSRSVTRYESQQECRSEMVTRYEYRTETQYETVWIPPKQRVHSYWHKMPELLEAEPEVHAQPIR